MADDDPRYCPNCDRPVVITREHNHVAVATCASCAMSWEGFAVACCPTSPVGDEARAAAWRQIIARMEGPNN